MLKNIILFASSILLSNAALAQEWDANQYRNHSNIQYDVAKKVLMEVDEINGTPLVLDVGCGDGRVTHDLVLKYLNPKKVIAVDPSLAMLDKAKQSYSANPKLQFSSGSFQTLNEDAKYDYVTTFFAQHWVPKEEQALAVKNLAKALKPGGFLIAAHVVNSKKHSLRQAIQETVSQQKWKTYFPQYQPPVYPADPFELQSLLTENHFRLKRFVTLDYATKFANDEDFYHWIEAWSPYKALLGEKHKAFWQEVIATYKKQTHQSDKIKDISYQDFYIEIIAEKI